MFSKSFLKEVAKREGVELAFLETQLAKGRVVIPCNKKSALKKAVAIGEGFKVKINANIGTSTEEADFKDELEKLRVAIEAGADAVMDLSTGGDLARMRKSIRENCSVVLGTVPIYEAALHAEKKRGNFEKMTFADIYEVLEAQAEDGVDFFTIHAGILQRFIGLMEAKKRVGSIVSRGGAILTRWMYCNKKENPMYEHFDKILELAKRYNIAISLGDALRPGAIADSTDQLQLSELFVLQELVGRCRKYGVQVMVEGPGHIRIDEIGFNMALEKKLCDRAPFYVLGPLVTDIAAGYDHIVSAIGGAIAALHGADFLCVVTPAEHLRHPSVEDIKEGVIASRIAAHSVDVLRFEDEWKRDLELSQYRARRDWSSLFPLLLDEKKARGYRTQLDEAVDMCTMCGKFCSLKIVEKCKKLK